VTREKRKYGRENVMKDSSDKIASTEEPISRVFARKN
jgi:hypothetical protein